MRFLRWQPDWREISSARSVQLGVYAVAAVALITTTIAIADVGLFRLTQAGDRLFALLDQGDPAVFRAPRDDAPDANRQQSPVVDRRGYRIGTVEPVIPAARIVAPKIDEAPVRISRAVIQVPVAPAVDPRRDWYRGDGNTYTTVCVRLCDGAIRPVSFSATDDKFDQDQRACQSGCSAASRLYVYRNPGGSVADMTDLNGQPYIRLKTAFLFQTTYVANCSCRGQPWEQASADRHLVYALQDKAQRGDAKARADLRALGPKVAALTMPRTTVADVDSGSASTFRTKRQPPVRSAGGDFNAGARRSSQVLSSSSLDWQGATVMRLTAPSTTGWSRDAGSSGGRSSGSSSRDTGWRAKTFDAR